MGQRSKSNANNRVLASLLTCFKVEVKGWVGLGSSQRSDQGQRSRSNSWCTDVDIRGSAEIHYRGDSFFGGSVLQTDVASAVSAHNK